MPVLQNCECIMSWKCVKLCLPVIGSMADLYRWYPSKGPQVKRSTSQKVQSQKGYKSKDPQSKCPQSKGLQKFDYIIACCLQTPF